MSTISSFTNLSRATVLPATEKVVSQETIDFTLFPCVSGDVVELVKIPANTLVKSVTLFVETAGTSTATLGDGTNAAGWYGATSIATSGAKLVDVTGAAAYALQGKMYLVDDTIDATFLVSQAAAKLRVIVESVKVER